MNSGSRRHKRRRPSTPFKRVETRAEVDGGEALDSSLTRQVAVHQSYQGPIPPPAMLAAFEEIKPGLSERILRMAEVEGDHARLVERRALAAGITAELLGQLFGAGLAMLCLLASFRLAVSGSEWVAAILGGTTLTSVVAAFLRRKGDSLKL